MSFCGACHNLGATHRFRKRVERTKLRDLPAADRAERRARLAGHSLDRARASLVAAAAALVRAERTERRLRALAERRRLEAEQTHLSCLRCPACATCAPGPCGTEAEHQPGAERPACKARRRRGKQLRALDVE